MATRGSYVHISMGLGGIPIMLVLNFLQNSMVSNTQGFETIQLLWTIPIRAIFHLHHFQNYTLALKMLYTVLYYYDSLYKHYILLYSQQQQNRVNNSLHLWSEDISLVEEWFFFHSLRSEFHSILIPVEWKFTTQRVESRPVYSIFSPKDVITEVTPQGVTSVTKRVKIHSICFRE